MITPSIPFADVLDEIRRDIREIRTRLNGQTKDFFTVEEVARIVGRARYTVRSWITDKRIEAIRVTGTGPRGRLLIPSSELQKLIAEGKGSHIPPTIAGGSAEDQCQRTHQV